MTYENLSDREKAYVDAVAELRSTGTWVNHEHKGAGEFNSEDVYERMAEKGVEPYVRGHITQKKGDDHIAEAIEERLHQLLNAEDEPGTIRTEGVGAYEGPPEGVDLASSTQDFADRPVKSVKPHDAERERVTRDDTDTDETVAVPTDKLRRFAQRAEGQLQAAERLAEAADAGSGMDTYAQGKLEILQDVEAFLKEIRDSTDDTDTDDDTDPQRGSNTQ